MILLHPNFLNKEQASALIVWSATIASIRIMNPHLWRFPVTSEPLEMRRSGLAMPRLHDNSLSRCRRSRTLLRKIPFSRRYSHTAIALLLSEYIPTTDKAWVSTDSMLDYGCGNGMFVEYLRQRGFANCHGYDAYALQEGFGNPTILEQGPFDYIWSRCNRTCEI